jgi:predicted AlkP superfamily phosphohydrolase/phosphomutase
MIVIGVDGMDPVFLETHWASLPNLNRLRQTGDFHRLGTTIPPQSPVAWTSVTTGMDPGGHGIFDFLHRDPATRLPMSSMAEVTPPTHSLRLGPYLFPLSGGGLHSLRAGRAFWQILRENGVAATVIPMPANFPPAESDAESLSGMGTPDMEGSTGTFSFFTDEPEQKSKPVPGGRIVHVQLENGRANLRLSGPPNGFRRDNAVASVDLMVYADPTAQAARFDILGQFEGDQQVVLQPGEWSGWLKASFPLIRMVKSASGIFRIYLQEVHPHLRVYVSPVNIDPQNPELPISTPSTYSRMLTEAVGSFYTQGISEDTSVFRAGVFNRAEFLAQSHKVLADSLRMFRYQVDHFSEGLLFYYFSSVDQNSHMLWGKFDDDLLDIYRQVDGAIGEAMEKAGPGTALLIISDHGFAKFDYAVHLNSWLQHEGFLTLDDPANASDEESFEHVDWSRTQAYAVGLNGLYLNMVDREKGGIVSSSERDEVRESIAKKLLAFKDSHTGENVVDKVYFPETAFRGRNLKYSPDIFVGYRRGYRASWQTALGAVPKSLLEANDEAWIGDHCMASDEVPGVVLSNRKLKAASPQLFDITATILDYFNVPKGNGMIGQTVF